MIDYKNIVKCWLEDNAAQYITLKKDGRYQVASFKKTMVSDLMKHLENCEAKDIETEMGDTLEFLEPKKVTEKSVLNFNDVEQETDIIRRVKKVIGCVMNIDREIRLKDRLVEDFGMDSLDEVEILMGLEKEFGVEIPDEENWEWIAKNRPIKTVEDVIDAMEDKLKQYEGDSKF